MLIVGFIYSLTKLSLKFGVKYTFPVDHETLKKKFRLNHKGKPQLVPEKLKLYTSILSLQQKFKCTTPTNWKTQTENVLK